MCTHFYAAPFSKKCAFIKLVMFFFFCLEHYFQTIFFISTYFHKTISYFWKFNKSKDQVILDTFLNFAYYSSYLKTKTCLEKRLYNIFKTTDAIMWANTILESHLKFYKNHEKELSLNDSCNFHRPFNFRLLLTFKLS